LNNDSNSSVLQNKRDSTTAVLSNNNSKSKKYKSTDLSFHAFASTFVDISDNDTLMEDPLESESCIEIEQSFHIFEDDNMSDNDWSEDGNDTLDNHMLENIKDNEASMHTFDTFQSDIEETEMDDTLYTLNINNAAEQVHIFEKENEDIQFTPVFSKRDRNLMDQDKARIAADCISGNTPAPFRQTQCITYLPTSSESNKLEIDILRDILKPPEDGIENEKPKIDKSQPFGSHSNPLNWPAVTQYGIDEFNCENLAAACFPDLFPYGRGDFTQRGRPRSISIRQARKFYEQYADYTNGQLSYRFAKHKFWSFWIFNRANRHTLLSATNAFIAGTPTTKDMSREQMLAELEKGTSNILTMGLGRYEANLDGSDGFWHQQCQELQAAIREANYPTAFYTFTYADAHCPELYRLLPFPDHLSQEDILNLPYEEREKILSENQHIAAWFFYKRFQSFSKHMRNCLDTDWYWQRIESQFRTAFHTHGCLRMHNDHDLMKNCHKALLGFLALQKIEHLDLLDTEDIPDQNLFSTEEIKQSLVNVKDLIIDFLSQFTLCLSDNADKKGTCYYIGIAFDQENENSDDVRSGKQEKTSIQQGMLNPKVILTINDLSSCDAYTLEYELLKWLKTNAENVTLNKSALFGLGNRPENWKEMKCTLTLLKGQYRSARYRAYPELDLIFEEIDPDDSDIIKDKLNTLIEEGEEAKRIIIKFVDYMVSTYNPSMEDTGDERPLPRGEDVPHPCSYEFNAFDAEANNCTSEKDISFQDWLKDNETSHEFLVNQVQGPHDHNKGSCQEKNNKTDEIKCRFHFPFDLIENTDIIFEAHGKNSNGDIIYRTKIITKRNDSLINGYCRFMLDSWRTNMDFQIIMDPVACAQYIAKYTTKCETSSKQKVKFMRDIIMSSPEIDTNERILRRCAMKSEGNRDLGAQEIKFLNMGLPLVESSFKFTSVSLKGQRILRNIDDADEQSEVMVESVKSASYPSLRDLYAERLTFTFTDKCIKILPDMDLKDMNFNTFLIYFMQIKESCEYIVNQKIINVIF